MTDVTMIGLGAMGSALARAFIEAGHSVTIWNRTAARMKPLVLLGATAAGSPAEAVLASQVCVVCVDNYGTTRSLIEEAGMLEPLSGRTLVQLSTGTPAEARDLSRWLSTHGVSVLDGAIMPYPDGIGAEDAQILFAGPTDLFRSCKATLDCLGGDLRHVSEDVGAAAVLDMALLLTSSQTILVFGMGPGFAKSRDSALMYLRRCCRLMNQLHICPGASTRQTTTTPAQRLRSGMRHSTESSSMRMLPISTGKPRN